jgi:hypothetical protein
MKYYIHEKLDSSDKTAMLKARVDTEDILLKNDYTEVVVNTVFGVRKQKILKPLQLVSYWNNQRKWLKLIDRFNSSDTVFIQCPLINAVTDFSEVIRSLKAKKVHLIGVVHDLETLRYEKGSIPDYLYNRLYKAEQLALKQFDKVIVHNEAMKKRLIELGFEKDRLEVLEIFDYIYEGETKERKLTNFVSVAGNLSVAKAGYLRKVSNISDVLFDLYGVGISENEIPKNARYNGSFSPEELIAKIGGSFGLVWDGDSTSTCSGGFGKYLTINNPHKVSMLIAAKMPIIIWEKAALAEFVKKNDIGWAISNLDELTDLVKNISDKEYSKKLKNIEKVSEKVRSGYYLTKALERCEVKNG